MGLVISNVLYMAGPNAFSYAGPLIVRVFLFFLGAIHRCIVKTISLQHTFSIHSF